MKYLFFAVIIIGVFSCKSKPAKQTVLDSEAMDTVGKPLIDDRNNKDSSSNSYSQPEDIYSSLEKITFPKFDLNINDLEVVFGVNGIDIADSVKQKFVFSKERKSLSLIENADTVNLFENDELNNKIIHLTSSDKNDQFKVSYAFQYTIQYKIKDKGYPEKQDTTTYKAVKQEVGLTFRMPQFRKLNPTDEIKKRLKVSDSVKKKSSGDYGPETYMLYIANGQSFSIINTTVLWKIERFQNSRLQETKIVRLFSFEQD